MLVILEHDITIDMKLMGANKLSELDPSYITLARPAEESSVSSTFSLLRCWDLKNKDVLQ